MRAAGWIATCAALFSTIALTSAGADPSRAYAVVERIVYPGQQIDVANVTIRQHTRTIPDDFPVVRRKADLAGMIATRTLLPGRAIAPDMLRVPFVVEQGATITVSLEEGPLVIAMEAIALQDGAIGDTIRVRNGQNGRTVCAVVRTASQAEVC